MPTSLMKLYLSCKSNNPVVTRTLSPIVILLQSIAKIDIAFEFTNEIIPGGTIRADATEQFPEHCITFWSPLIRQRIIVLHPSCCNRLHFNEYFVVAVVNLARHALFKFCHILPFSNHVANYSTQIRSTSVA